MIDTPGGVNSEAWSQVRMGAQGAVVTNHPLSSLAGMRMLLRGGNAVDAAVAIGFALGVAEPQGSGIAADGFIMVHMKDKNTVSVANGTGFAPLAATPERFAGGIENLGILSVSVPGICDALLSAHERHGLLPLADCIAPAIQLCLAGVPQSHFQCRLAAGCDLMHSFPASAAIFAPDGRPLQPGEIRRNPDLARTYQIIAENGRDAFYTGPIARALVKFSEEAGGLLTMEDMARYRMVWQDPITTTYRGRAVYEAPPNSSGHVLLQELNLIEHFDMASLGLTTAAGIHVMVEAKKLAFEDRARFYADPAFYEVPIEQLLSKDYAAGRRDLIRMDKALLRIEVMDETKLEQGDTIYLTTADASGMMVSLIQSNYVGMGSGLVPDGLGFVLQDRGALFTFEPGHPNVYAPGKRPFHTIIPAFVMKEGEPFMSFGVMGGAMQPQGHVQILCNIIDFEMNVQEAGDAARYRHHGSSQPTGEKMTHGGTINLESGVRHEVVEALRRRGHDVWVGTDGGYGGYQAILWDAANGVYHGASEMRKDGQAAGY